jgi:hypothetical protein
LTDEQTALWRLHNPELVLTPQILAEITAQSHSMVFNEQAGPSLKIRTAAYNLSDSLLKKATGTPYTETELKDIGIIGKESFAIEQ